MNAEIIAVGTELLLGDILNTNAQFLSRELSNLGIDVFYQSVVGDNSKRMKEVIHHATKRADIVILSGGLGPTDDDLTKEIVAEHFELPLIFHQEIVDEITEYLKGRFPKGNIKQAYIPEGALIIHNNYGTAPAFVIEKDGKTIVLLPGPPRELCPIFLEQIRPILEEKTDFTMRSKMLRLFGIGESTVGELISDIMQSQNPTVAPYAKDNEVLLRITAKAKTEAEANELISKMLSQVEDRVGAFIYGFGDNNMQQTVGRLLLEKGITIATAESCTAGLVAATLAEVSGISGAISESIVTYSNEAKIKYLGVLPETVQEYGAVSAQTASEMAEGIRKSSGADIGLSVTGLAGPDGGSAQKPVGLVFIGVSTSVKTVVKELRLSGTRQKIRYGSVLHALNEVRKII